MADTAKSATGSELPWKSSSPGTITSLDPLAQLPSKLYRVNGQPTKFWGIRALGKLLGQRSADTMRSWEERGWLPKPTAVFPGRDPRSAASAKHGRRRLYTRAQMIGLYKIAGEEGILEKHARIESSNFPRRAKKLFIDLAEKARQEAERKAS